MKKVLLIGAFIVACASIAFSCGLVDYRSVADAISTWFAQAPSDMFTFSPWLIGVGTVTLSDVPVDDDLSAVAISYKNGKFIADEVLPYVQVTKQTFKYRKGRKEDAYRIKETKVGRASAPNRVTTGWDEVAAICEDDALDFPIPRADIDNARPEDQNRIVRNATESIMGDILMGREQRVSSLIFAAATYPSGYKTQLSGTSQWSNASSTPIKAILDALDIPLLRPNVIVFSAAGWSSFRQHASIVKATNRNAGDAGVAARQAVAELFEVDKVVVGLGRYSTAKKGLTPALAYLWGKHCALLYIPQNINEFSSDTFGFTGRWGSRISGQMPDQNIGMRGGIIVRAGESTKEVVTESMYGYFFEDCVA